MIDRAIGGVGKKQGERKVREGEREKREKRVYRERQKKKHMRQGPLD